MVAWPGLLPQEFLFDSLSDFQFQNGAIHVPTDVGPGISRQRTTVVSEYFSGEMLVTPTQYDTLEAFYKTSLLHGVLDIQWNHPLTGAAVDMKFDLRQTPHLSVSSLVRADLWRVFMAMEILGT